MCVCVCERERERESEEEEATRVSNQRLDTEVVLHCNIRYARAQRIIRTDRNQAGNRESNIKSQ